MRTLAAHAVMQAASMDLHAADHVVIVSGGSAGIGRAPVRALLDEGASVCAFSRNCDRLNAARDEHPRLLLQRADATSTREVDGNGGNTVSHLFAIKIYAAKNLVDAAWNHLVHESDSAIVIVHAASVHSPDRTWRQRGIPIGRLGNPSEVVAITFLLSPRASHISGTSIDVAGGLASRL